MFTPPLSRRPAAPCRSLAIAVCIAVGVTACAAGSADGPATPSPVAAFPSDEAAYEAAVAAYTEYSTIFDAVGQAGGEGAERLLDVLDTDYANQLLKDAYAMQDKGLHFTGSGRFRPDGLAEIDPARAKLKLKVCEDVGDTRLINADGTDVTPADRKPVTPLLVSFVVTETGKVLISGSDLWSGENFC